MTSPMSYQSPPAPAPIPPRSAATWMLLLFIWTVGLAMWTIYLGIAAVVLLRVL
jgi:hypothetical protein